MKNAAALTRAKKRLALRILTPNLSNEQKALICGMVNALDWVLGGPNSTTMERMLTDEPMDAGKDATQALAKLDPEALKKLMQPPHENN